MNAATKLFMFPDQGARETAHAAYLCPNCYRLNVASEFMGGYSDGFEAAPMESANSYAWRDHVQWLPKLGETRDFPDVPESIAAAATEATLCLSMGAYRAVGALARAVIEATAKDKTAEGRNLESRIDALAKAGHIRPHTQAQAHEIRHFGNDMAHGDFAEPTTMEEATEVLELMSEVLNEVYQSPAKLAKVRDARLAKKAESN